MELNDFDTEADDEELYCAERTPLSYEGTLWSFGRMMEEGWIQGEDYRTTYLVECRPRGRPRHMPSLVAVLPYNGFAQARNRNPSGSPDALSPFSLPRYARRHEADRRA